MGKRVTRGKYKRFTAKRRPDAYAGQMQNACYGIPSEEIAQLCKVDITTARRWKFGHSRLPWTASVILTADFSALRGMQNWEGWRVAANDLVSPDNWRISRNDALSVPLLVGQLKAKDERIAKLEAEIARLKDTVGLEDQPAPTETLPQIITSA